MTRRTLIWNSLRHHARAHLGTLLGATVASAVLIGALVVGDSVRFSLRQQALQRLGDVHLAMVQHDRYFRAALADELELGSGVTVAPLLRLSASAIARKGKDATTLRAPHVRLLGVDDRFWVMARPGKDAPDLLMEDDADDRDVIDVFVNPSTANRLELREGDKFTVRVAKPSLLPRDVPLAVEGEFDDLIVKMTLRVAGILGKNSLGDFNLRPDPIAPFNIFIPLKYLQPKAGQQGRGKPSLMAGLANTLVVASRAGQAPPNLLETANHQLAQHWQLADAQLRLQPVEDAPGPPMVELITDRVFLDEPTVAAAEAAGREENGSQTILAYMVNRIDLGANVVPYSIVAAVPDAGPGLASPTNQLPQPGQMLITDWLHSGYFGAQPGDSIRLTYFKLGGNRELREANRTFTVAGIVPTGGPGGDSGVMPPFPGVRELDSIGELDQLGFRPDPKLLRTHLRENDQYWDDHKGAPKAFIHPDDAKAMWANRYGVATAVRFPGGTGALEKVRAAIRRQIDPDRIGLAFRDVRSFAVEGNSASDFGGLFIGLSFFLVAAALILMGLLFVFGVEQRAAEVGTLLAVGFTGKQVRNLLLAEGSLLAVLGALLGAAAGLGYTRAMVYGLSHQWVGAIGGRDVIQYHHEPATVVMGVAIGIAVAGFTIWLTVRRLRRARAVELLAAGAGQALPSGKIISGKRSCVIALACLAAALGLGVAMADAQGMAKAGGFFGAGALLLVGGLFLCRSLLIRLGGAGGEALASLGALGIRGSARRRGRSLACVCLLACGVFLVIAVGAFRINPNDNAGAPASGTGGFAFYAESDLPVLHDLNDEKGRYHYPFEDYSKPLPSRVVPLRVRAGDDASCLNLNQTREPRLLGVAPEQIKTRGDAARFTFADSLEVEGKSGWDLLAHDFGEGIVPAVMDLNTGMWALHLKTGDTLEYPSEGGGSFKLKIVGMLAFSMLQGDVIVAEDALLERFPSISGYRAFLIDPPTGGNMTAVRAVLSEGLKNHGLDLSRAEDRLAQFSQVQNTYISIFQALGGLALLLGSLGLGVVVLRNVLERRGELAAMQAVGFRKGALRWLVCSEHGLLLALGLGVGAGAAFLAVWPSLTQMPWRELGWVLAGVAASGILWTWLAATMALRGKLLSALRNE